MAPAHGRPARSLPVRSRPVRSLPVRSLSVQLAVLLAVLLTIGATGAAQAQTLRLGLAGGRPGSAPAGGGRVSVRIENASVGDTRVALGLAFDGEAQLDFGVQANDTFGPLGNIVGDVNLSLRTDGQAQGVVTARGVLGPVALGLSLSGFTADPARFDPLALAGTTRPDLGAAGWAVGFDASGRPSRTLVVEARPQLFLVPAGAAWRLTSRLRWLRAIGPHELSLRLQGYLEPAAQAGDVALGLGFTYRRRRAPDLDGAIYLGDSPRGLRPGATASLAQQIGPVEASVQVAAEPYRLDVPPYRLQLELSFDAGPGQARVEGAGATGPNGPRGVLAVRYRLPVDLPSP
ncbi:MAG: hypothetical protein P8Y13_01645 [Deinococcales bacterium]